MEDSGVPTLAQEKGYANREQYVAAWARQQLDHYVNKLSGKRPLEGERRFLQEAIQHTAQIIPFLSLTLLHRRYTEGMLL